MRAMETRLNGGRIALAREDAAAYAWRVRAANLRGADDLRRLYEAGERDFRGAQLACADLTGAELEGADLSTANLAGASLIGSNLRNTRLVRSDLAGAILRQADLRGADLRGTPLGRADLKAARYDAATRFPAGFSPVDGCLMPESGFLRRADALSAAAGRSPQNGPRRAGHG